MRPQYLRAVCAAAAFGVLACGKDPTEALRNGPASLSVTPSQIFEDTGKAVPLVVFVRDAQLNPLPADVTVVSADPTIAKVEVDTTRPSIDGASHAFVVTLRSPNRTKLTVTGGGLTDSIPTAVLPLAFTGAISNLTPKGGDTITIQSTAVLKFNPTKTVITFGGGELPLILTRSANTFTMLAPFSDAGTLTIDSVVVTYVTGLELTLPSASSVHQVGDHWAGDNSWQTAPDITGLLPAASDSAKMLVGLPGTNNVSVCPEGVLGFGSSGPCMMFKFTLASPTTLAFATSWVSGDGGKNPDMDIYACSDSTVANFGSACFEEGGAGAASSNPEKTGNFTYAAGTHYFVVEYYAACDDNDPTKCLTNGKTRNYFVTISRP